MTRLRAQMCTEWNELQLLSQLDLGHFDAISEIHLRGTDKNQVLELEIYLLGEDYTNMQYLASIRQCRRNYQLRTWTASLAEQKVLISMHTVQETKPWLEPSCTTLLYAP